MKYSILGLLALAACASAGGGTAEPTVGGNTQIAAGGGTLTATTPGSTVVTSADVAAPVDRVWQVLPTVYQEMGLEANAQAATRTVAAPAGSMSRRFLGQPAGDFFDCGRGQYGVEFSTQAQINFNVQTTVQPGADGGSRLETSVAASGRSRDGGANALLVVCHTRGALERAIATRVREKLGM